MTKHKMCKSLKRRIKRRRASARQPPDSGRGSRQLGVSPCSAAIRLHCNNLFTDEVHQGLNNKSPLFLRGDCRLNKTEAEGAGDARPAVSGVENQAESGRPLGG